MFSELLDSDVVDDYGPEKLILVRDPSLDMEGALVIDNEFYGLPVGGIRISPNLTIEKLIRLARGMSQKFCSFKIPLSGAQAGIICNNDINRKNQALKSFVFSIKALIKQADYFPEPDLGIFDTDYNTIFKMLGKPKILTKNVSFININEPFKMEYRGSSAYYCLQMIFNELDKYQNRSTKKWNSPPKLLLEGFGRAGEKFAHHINENKMELLGVSTLRGAIFDENGLDLEKLFELKQKYGDNLVNEYESKDVVKLKPGDFFNLSSEYPIDFIIPGAEMDTINEDNVDKIGAKVIIPAASSPYSVKVLKSLEEFNFFAFPDFISNAGDVIELWSRRKKEDPPIVEHEIKNKVNEKTLDLLKKVRETKKLAYYIAKDNALNELVDKIEVKKKRFY